DTAGVRSRRLATEAAKTAVAARASDAAVRPGAAAPAAQLVAGERGLLQPPVGRVVVQPGALRAATRATRATCPTCPAPTAVAGTARLAPGRADPAEAGAAAAARVAAATAVAATASGAAAAALAAEGRPGRDVGDVDEQRRLVVERAAARRATGRTRR